MGHFGDLVEREIEFEESRALHCPRLLITLAVSVTFMIKVFVANIQGHQSYLQASQGIMKEIKTDLWMFKYTGCFFFNWYPPKKLKYVKPRLGVSTLT